MKITQLFSYFLMLVFIGLTTISCLSDDSAEPYDTYGFVPALELTYNQDSINPVNKPTKFHVTFPLEGNCQEFLEFKKMNTTSPDKSDIGVFVLQKNNTNCVDNVVFVTKSFTLTPTQSGENTVRLWAGKDISGEDMFITKVINIPAE